MVTDRQVRKLRKELGTGMTLATAAARSGMSEKTAREHWGHPAREHWGRNTGATQLNN